MSMVEKLKAKRAADRNLDPHAWAEEMERRIDQRLWGPALAGLLSIAAFLGMVFMWREVESMRDRIKQLELVSDLPPPGFTVVE